MKNGQTIKISCGLNNARFLKYVWPFFNIMQELVNPFVPNVLSLYPLKASENRKAIKFPGCVKYNIEHKWANESFCLKAQTGKIISVIEAPVNTVPITQ